jgi:hypothetical protein
MSRTFALPGFTTPLSPLTVERMARPKSNKIPVGLRLDKNLLKQLDSLLLRMFGDTINRTWAVEKALKEFIERMEVAASVLEHTHKPAATEKAKKGKQEGVTSTSRRTSMR